MSPAPGAKTPKVDDDEYFAMVEAGVFGRRRVSLWGGKLVEKMAKTNAHAFVAGSLSDALAAILPGEWLLRYENPVRLGDRHVPLPDIVVLRGPRDRYRDERPLPRDVGLLIEVAVTSLAKDLGERAARYAEAGVISYWVADVANRRIIEHRGPRADGTYESVRHHEPGDEVELILDGAALGRIAVSDLF